MPVISTNGMGQMASIVETKQETDMLSGLIKFGTFTLSEFPRAAELAPYFKFYRAAKVVYTYEPLYNTFQDTAGAISKPYIYIAMNRTQEANQPGVGLAQLQAQGARPRALTKNIVVSYKPNWCSPGVSIVYTDNALMGKVVYSEPQGLKVENAWLSTPDASTYGVNRAERVTLLTTGPVISPFPPGGGAVNAAYPVVQANCVQYNGHVAYVDQSIGNASGNPIARVTISVHWEFKGAKCNRIFPPPAESLSPLKVLDEPPVASA